ncbi:MAG: hypothetical protein J5717_00855 [Lachnospiraceae bacterium]|nr:hypothetical protein [Lachnospiraceae bacterium]
MGLGPLELSGAIQRSQDFAAIRHNEEHKGQTDQANFVNRLQKEVSDNANTVKSTSEVLNEQKKFDAKEKGSNEYTGDGGKHHDKEEDAHGHKNDKDSVHLKMSESSFDIRI